jgi:hypothetical protein
MSKDRGDRAGSLDPSVVRQRIKDRIPRVSEKPVPLLAWWDTSSLFQGENIPFTVRAQAKLDLLFGDNVSERKFREFPPITFFTIRQRVEPGEEEQFRNALTSAALDFEEAHGYPFRYSGFFSQSQIDGQPVTFYNFTHYPRTREPVVTYRQTVDAALFLEQKLLQEGVHPSLTMIRGKWDDLRVTEKDCRIILGLEEGYSTDRKTGEKGKVYTLEEISEPEFLGPTISARGVNIYSVWRKADGTLGEYAEPAAEVRCTLNELPVVYKAAERMKQARFTVDAFRKSGTSYTVELSEFCKGQQADPIPSMQQWLNDPKYAMFRSHM